MLVARANGAVKPLHQLAAELPRRAVRAGLQPPNVADTGLVADRLKGLAAEAGVAGDRSAVVSILIPDAAVRVALAPLEGTEPRGAEGDAMARWALENLLPVEAAEARIDWSVVTESREEPAAKWLLAVGADVAVVRDYEAVVEAVGWTAGRVVPMTVALAVGAADAAVDRGPGTARILLSGAGGQVACLVEAGGVPRFHRSWRGGDPDLVRELPSIQRYLGTRLDLSIVDAIVAGPQQWRERTVGECRTLGWRVRERSSWSAHIGVVQP